MLPRFALALGLVLALLAPAAAQAATFTVDPADSNKSCTGSDTTCSTIAQALQAAKAADTVKVLKGTYAEAVSVASGKDGLKLEGTGIGEVKITGSGTGDVVTIASKDVTVSGLTVDVPANGQSAVAVGETGAKLTAVVLQRATASTANVPVVDVAEAGAVQIATAFVVQSAGAAGTPAVLSPGAGGVTLTDTLVVSNVGPALVVEGSEANRIIRSQLLVTEPDSDAVRVLSGDAGKRTLTIDSSIFVGGAKAAGLLARSTGATAGDISLQVRHATIALSAKGIVLDASGATGQGLLTGATAAGNIDADVFSSIVHGTSSTDRYQPTLPIQGTANTASLTFSNSDAPPAEANDGTVEMGGATSTPDAELFAPKSLKLRPNAAVVDKGGALQAGESTTDVDGNPREVDGGDADTAAQSDIGADEYVNQPPKALFGITNKNPRQNEAIGFVSGSTDPEQGAGGGIVEWRWDFGDGKKEVTKVGGVAHAYTEVGTYKATLQVVDAQGLVSAVTPAQEIVVKDGIPPTLAVTAPVDGAKLNLKSTYLLGARRPKPLQLTLLGTVADASGVDSVEIALALTKRDRVKKARKRRKRASSSATALCEFYSGRLFTKKKDCTKETWVKATLVPGGWTLKTRKGLRLPAGRYTLRVRAKDKTGLLTTDFSTKAKTLVNFRVK
jgi:hypothetical protein